MLSLTSAATCKQCQKSSYRIKRISADLYNISLLTRFQGYRFLNTINRNRSNTGLHVKQWRTTHYTLSIKSLSTTTSQRNSDSNRADYNYDVLSVALDQSNAVIAQTLTENTFRLLKKGSPELAWDCYQDLASQGIQKYISRHQYNHLVQSFYKQKNNALGLESVLTLVEDMKSLGYIVGRNERILMMRLLGQNGKLKEMESIFEDLKRDGLLIVADETQTRKAFNVMIYAYEEQKKTIGFETVAENIMRIYQDMLNHRVQPAPATTTTFLESVRSAGYSDSMVEKVNSWIRPKIEQEQNVENTLLDPKIYQSLVFYFSNAGRPDYALEVNDFMVKNNIPRTLSMMTALMHKVGRAGNIDRSMALFNEMVNKENIEPSIVTFNALIDIHAHKKPEPDVEGANRAYDMLREAKLLPDIYTFATLMDMFAKKGDIAMLRRVYRYMSRRKNIKPNDYVSSSIVECLVKVGDLDSAIHMLTLLRKNGVNTSVVLDLIFKGFINTDRILDAFSLLKAININSGPKAKTFLPLLNYYASQGDTKSAHEVAALLVRVNVPPTSDIYTALLKAHGKARDTAGAERILGAYKKKWRLDIAAYNALLHVYVNANETEKVFETYSLISNANVKPDERTYGTLMLFYSRRKDVQAVESIMDTMSANGISPGVVCRTILMQTYFEAHRSSDAKAVMDQMLQAGLEPSSFTWSILVNGFAKSDEMESAESVLIQAIERSKQSTQQNLLKNANVQHTKNIEPYKAFLPQTIEDVLDKADEFSAKRTLILSPFMFNPLIDINSKNGNFDRAKQWFNTMVELDVPVSVPVYVVLMNMFQQEKRHDAVEILWNSLYKPKKDQTCIEGVVPEINRIPLPKKKYDYLHLLTVTDETAIQVNESTKETIPEQASNFALSVYIDSLVEQARFQDVEILWNQLESEHYTFDDQNWNRYIVSLLGNSNLEKACNIVSEQFLASDSINENEQENPGSRLVNKYVRKRDKLDVDTSNQIHDRTCFTFATSFQIPGAENMGVLRLRSTVVERIKKFMRDKPSRDL